MFELLLIRHGQTDWNAQQRVMGRQPIPLNDTGRAQAKALANYLKDTKLDAIVTSPVKRAVETAEILLKDRFPSPQRGEGGGEGALIFDERFSEIEYGEWVNLTFNDLTTKHADIWRDYHHDPENIKIPGGERLPDVVKRTKDAVFDLEKKYPDGRIAIISHADVIKLAVIGVLDWPISFFSSFSIDNCATILLRRHPTLGMRIIWFNHINGIGRDIRDGQ